ncbi:MAG: glutamate-5-semialdehyde dehydrogenase [Victivallaceae bacterium]|nr:glutamate-5-semialdehyde dehydrogenase [Victivallaceae bacterium]
MTATIDYAAELEAMGIKARRAASVLGAMSAGAKRDVLCKMADALAEAAAELVAANAVDVAKAKAGGLSDAMIDRLTLSPARVAGMADGLRGVAAQDEVVGRTLASFVRPNGIKIEKISVPIGVIGIIYESRPNVTSDAAGICLKAGNAVILRGGSEAFNSNLAIAGVMNRAGVAAGLPDGAVQLLPWTDHAAVNVMLKLDRYIDLIIPRGGERLIRTVVEQSTIPVIKHYKGVCHIYVDAECDRAMALNIIENAKCQRPGVCNAAETVLIARGAAAVFAPELYKKLNALGVEMHGDAEFNRITGNTVVGTEEELYNEYLCLKLSVRIVDGVEQAVAHINHYGSHHSDAIVTSNPATAEYFQKMVDSATVYWNASTRFTDGGEFGMGAEIGISTDKLHARGPMGAAELTTTKYLIRGNGQVRK